MPENVRRYADGETGFFGVMMKALTDGVTVHPASERRDEEGGLSRIGELGPARFDVDFDGFLGFRRLQGKRFLSKRKCANRKISMMNVQQYP